MYSLLLRTSLFTRENHIERPINREELSALIQSIKVSFEAAEGTRFI